MARRYILIDDLDGGPADETVRFGLDAIRDLEIDLSVANAERLRAALALYIQHARRVSGRPRRIQAGSPSTPGADVSEAAVKPAKVAKVATRHRRVNRLAYSREVPEWALAEGKEVAAQGQLSDEVVRAYRRQHKGHYKGQGRGRRGR